MTAVTKRFDATLDNRPFFVFTARRYASAVCCRCESVRLSVCHMHAGIISQVSAAADRPARRRGSAHAKYSVSHHMIIKPFLLLGLAAEYKSRRWVWSTVVRRPSKVYDTHRRTKLTAPETISSSRDMVGAHQNLNGSRYLTTPLSGMVCHPWSSTFCHQPTYQIWSLYLHSLQRYERRYKMSKCGGLG